MIPPARCADLIPSDWAQGVEAAPIPTNSPMIPDLLGKPLTATGAATIVGPWASGYVAQDGQLAKANGRTADAIAIFRRCEQLVNEARPENRR